MPQATTSLPPEMRKAVEEWGASRDVPVVFGPALRELLRRALAAEGVKVGESKARARK